MILRALLRRLAPRPPRPLPVRYFSVKRIPGYVILDLGPEGPVYHMTDDEAQLLGARLLLGFADGTELRK